MIAVIIILSCLLTCFFFIMLFEFIIIVGLCKQIDEFKNVIAEEEKHRKTAEELVNKLSEVNVMHESEIKSLFNKNICEKLRYMSTILTTYKLLNEQESYSAVYNQLYFIGISKDLLDDEEKMKAFLNDLEEEKYLIEDGEKPFAYKFILKENQ